MVDEKFGERQSSNFKEQKKFFWQEVNAERKLNEQLDMRI